MTADAITGSSGSVVNRSGVAIVLIGWSFPGGVRPWKRKRTLPRLYSGRRSDPWPAFAARRTGPRPRILSVYGSAAVTAVFVGLLGWLLIEAQGGSLLGLAERLTSSLQTSWPFVVAVALRRANA